MSKNKESKGYVDIISYLKTADPQHSSEYDDWLRDIKGDEHQKGCHYFWRGEIMVCKSKSSYVSLKLSSKKTVGAEFLNRENRRGLWLGTGVLSLYTHPDDFKNIYPLWDWSKLPGVTSYGESEMKEKRVTNQTNFVEVLSIKLKKSERIVGRKRYQPIISTAGPIKMYGTILL